MLSESIPARRLGGSLALPFGLALPLQLAHSFGLAVPFGFRRCWCWFFALRRLRIPIGPTRAIWVRLSCRRRFPLEPYRRLLEELPEQQRELSRILGVPAATQPIHVYLFADADEYQRYLSALQPDVPYRRALFVKSAGVLSVYAYRQAELDVDLRHECTHALLHSVLAEVPLWLDEGLAEYFEMPPGKRAFDHPNLEALRWNVRLGLVRSVESLEQRQELDDMTSADYRQAWAWVHYMLHGPEAAHLRWWGTWLSCVDRQESARRATHFPSGWSGRCQMRRVGWCSISSTGRGDAHAQGPESSSRVCRPILPVGQAVAACEGRA